MKTVFDNKQLAHVWAQQSQDAGRSNNGNVFFHGPTIYSYGHHFPLAHFFTDNIVLINGDSYSNSTSKHQSYVRQAVNHKERIYLSTRVINSITFDNTFNTTAQSHLKTETMRSFENHMALASKRRIKRCKASDTQNALNALIHGRDIFIAFGANVPAEIMMTITKAKDENNDFLTAYIQDLKDLEEKKRANEQKLYDIEKTKWLNHNEANSSNLRFGPVLMRLKNDETIETSKGAQFPLDHAIKAFKLVRMIKERSLSWDACSIKTIHLGHFKIDNIDLFGNVKAGCHTVQWDEIERLARILKIYP